MSKKHTPKCVLSPTLQKLKDVGYSVYKLDRETHINLLIEESRYDQDHAERIVDWRCPREVMR
jgi:hypothetical protein